MVVRKRPFPGFPVLPYGLLAQADKIHRCSLPTSRAFGAASSGLAPIATSSITVPPPRWRSSWPSDWTAPRSLRGSPSASRRFLGPKPDAPARRQRPVEEGITAAQSVIAFLALPLILFGLSHSVDA